MSLTQHAHKILLAHIQPGDITIDATLGNGHDTVFLAQQVGEHGKVYGFDVQQRAIDLSMQRLRAHQLESRACLFQAGHENMQTLIPEKNHGHVRSIMFNLGYLPGSDKNCVTRSSTTIAALQMAMQLLTAHGIISLMAYTGHPGGHDEYLSVKKFLHQLPDDLYSCQQVPEEFTPNSPVLFIIQKQIAGTHQ